MEKASAAAAQRASRGSCRSRPTRRPPPTPKGISEGYAHYLRTKKAAEVFLTRTGLDWIIVRPGHLVDKPGDGLVTAGPALVEQDVPRDDVAAFIVAALHEPTLSRTIVELADGATPVTDAARQVAQLRRSHADNPSRNQWPDARQRELRTRA